MKKVLLGMVVLMASQIVLGAPRLIEIKTEKINDAVHWVPEKIEVNPGEEIKFVVKHDLEGGFDFHGFFVPQLKIQKQINRHKAEEILVSIPKDMKPGDYPIGCHFHPKHVAATLVVKKAP